MKTTHEVKENTATMKVLIVCSINSGKIAPFVADQVEVLQQHGVETDYFTVAQKGWRGYLKSRKGMVQKIAEFRPDIIHAHFGLCGLLANLQRKVPVVTTYHGSDINERMLRYISLLSLLLSKFNIFVSAKQAQKVTLFRKRYAIIPCGINFTNFYPMPKQAQREALGWDDEKKYILFSSSFDRPEKNSTLALKAIDLLPNYTLIEMKGYSREQMNVLMNACDAGLLTSLNEGSPMFIKEMIACKKPLVATDVGDVRELLDGVEGCQIVDFSAQEIANALEKAVQFDGITYPQQRMNAINNIFITKTIAEVYSDCLRLNNFQN